MPNVATRGYSPILAQVRCSVPSSQKLASSPNITTPRQAFAFFYRWEFVAEPNGLSLDIGAGEALAWALDGEPAPVEQPGI